MYYRYRALPRLFTLNHGRIESLIIKHLFLKNLKVQTHVKIKSTNREMAVAFLINFSDIRAGVWGKKHLK